MLFKQKSYKLKGIPNYIFYLLKQYCRANFYHGPSFFIQNFLKPKKGSPTYICFKQFIKDELCGFKPVYLNQSISIKFTLKILSLNMHFWSDMS